MGTIYSLEDIAAVVAVAKTRGLRVHIDGARVANALVALECSPADMTWRAGVDVLSLGATKNGALSAEAIVAFDERAADELVYRTKRAGHVTSKMRLQAAADRLSTDRTAAHRSPRTHAWPSAHRRQARRPVRQPARRQHAVAYVDDAAADRSRRPACLLRMGRARSGLCHKLADNRRRSRVSKAAFDNAT
jgi:hypothetical protein